MSFSEGNNFGFWKKVERELQVGILFPIRGRGLSSAEDAMEWMLMKQFGGREDVVKGEGVVSQHRSEAWRAVLDDVFCV